MPVKKSKTYELDIIDLAFGGKGLAKPDGFPVFVDRCIPGDRVFVKIFKKKKSWAEGRLINIVNPSPLRQEASIIGFAGGANGSNCLTNASLNTRSAMFSSRWRTSGA